MAAKSGEVPEIRRRRVRSLRRRDGLIRFAKDVTSQNGEDGIIERIFDLLPVPETRWCVDVGAWDGVHLSNTYSLLLGSGRNTKTSARRWKGILIEADPIKCEKLSALHQPYNNDVLNRSVASSSDSQNSLASLLESQVERQTSNSDRLPLDFDFLCIDIDGSDYWALHDLWERTNFRPKVVCIEFNPTMPADLVFIPCRSDSIRQGASLAALVELAERFDYALVETTLYNAFFIKQTQYEMYLKGEVPDTSIEALHEITMGTNLYQLYDGTLKLWGCRKMLWHRLAIDESKIQMLDSAQRQFPFGPSTPSKESFDTSSVAIDLQLFDQMPKNVADADTRCQQATKIMKQLKQDGFCYVRGLGVSKGLCQSALNFTNAFLNGADEDVRRSCGAKDRARRGYSPINTENFASLIGEEAPNDLVRKYRIGPLDPGNTSTLLQPNIWPSNEKWDSAEAFRGTMEDFYRRMCLASHRVATAIVEGLTAEFPHLGEQLSPLLHSVANSSSNQTSILTLLGYQVTSRHKKPRKNKQMSPLVAAHTDVGVVTILIFDSGDCATLQRKDERQGWVDVKLPSVVANDPVFVVNVADCLSDLCGGTLPSTLHRVVASNGTSPRNCCALFLGLDPSTKIEVYGKSLSYEEWRRQRIHRAQLVLRNGSQDKS